ncbi:MAG: Undecaprenyl-phosphate 4-deoxy-4-formamido-L-arabinose transferase [Chloroflexi bacterium]|nr:Undecaprenyl-phosphate 4-deoxy-4-formamido-L-arabinose transferase [Chloroflexota bacterium]
MRPSITAFFPAYNDSGTIASMVVVADMTLRQLTDDYEVIVVNDGSPDHCGQILAELQTRYPRLRVVTHEKNRGYGGALRSGFSNATKDLIFYTDGDAQYDPRELTVLYKALDDSADMVNGYKISRSDPINRKIIGRIYHHVVSIAFGLKLSDVDCDFRLIRRSVFDVVKLDSNSGVICVELMKRIQDAGFRIVEVPVHHFHRAFGISQFFNFRRVFRSVIDLVRLWYRLVWKGESRRTATVPSGNRAESTAIPAPQATLEIGVEGQG